MQCRSGEPTLRFSPTASSSSGVTRTSRGLEPVIAAQQDPDNFLASLLALLLLVAAALWARR